MVGYEHAVAMHLTLWYVVLVCHHYDGVTFMLTICMLVGVVHNLLDNSPVCQLYSSRLWWSDQKRTP